ncbi:hypothetical protein QL285_039157 [Trifolium repens]|nr:hypothetical protein QL285_039157 [Trifolium repens]
MFFSLSLRSLTLPLPENDEAAAPPSYPARPTRKHQKIKTFYGGCVKSFADQEVNGKGLDCCYLIYVALGKEEAWCLFLLVSEMKNRMWLCMVLFYHYFCPLATSPIGSGNGLNMYLSPGTWVRFSRKAKTPIEKGVGEDREVAVSRAPKARAVTLTLEFQSPLQFSTIIPCLPCTILS